MCRTCDKALNLEGPEIFWQLLIKKEFVGQLTSELQAADGSSSPSKPCSSRTLSHVEENAVRYTAGYVVRKLEQKYTKCNTQEAAECVAALREMAVKLNPTTTPTQPDLYMYTDWILFCTLRYAISIHSWKLYISHFVHLMDMYLNIQTCTT